MGVGRGHEGECEGEEELGQVEGKKRKKGEDRWGEGECEWGLGGGGGSGGDG